MSLDWTAVAMPYSERDAVPAPLERLPLHILERVCEYLADYGRGQRGLHAFSLTSKLCYLAATPQRFARLRLTIRSKQKLRDDLARCIEVLGHDNRFRHVRRVTAIGFMPDEPLTPGFELRANGWNGSSDANSEDVDEGMPSWTYDVTSTPAFSPSEPRLTPQHKQAQHDAWLPFAHFLGRLPALTDLVYACTHQMPACVLEALHKHHPRSRLHMHAFSLRSAYQSHEGPLQDIDPDEFALATSPCLYSIDTAFEVYDTDGRFGYNWDALRRLVSGLAPALRRLRIRYTQPGNTLALQQAIRRRRPAWPGFFPTSSEQTVVPFKQGRIDTLALTGVHKISDWDKLLDFGLLRRLELGYNFEDFEWLMSLAASDRLCSLRHLELSFDAEDHQIASLLLAVTCLEVLSITARSGHQIFEAVLQRHGQTLRSLCLLTDVLSPTQIYEVQHRCPRLEEIKLRLLRYQGGPKEVAVYDALAQLPRLKRATLVLDCQLSNPGVDRRQNKRNALINAAIDETLALAIFRRLSVRPDSALERLKLVTEVPWNAGWNMEPAFFYFDNLTRWTAWSWVCSRYGSEVTARKVLIDRRGDVRNVQWEREHLQDTVSDEHELKALWNEVWPRRTDTDSWVDDWVSVPLSEHEPDGN